MIELGSGDRPFVTPPPSLPRATARAARVGDQVGPYRLVRLIGSGAVGTVFEVVHERLGRRAALKLLAPELGARPTARARFFAEALSVNRMSNPHIVEVTDVVETEAHQALVMELLEGQPLSAIIAAGAATPERFLPILAEVCEALTAAHAAGFVHRDLKPDNVYLCARPERGDFVKLLDFGLATTFSASGDSGDEIPARSVERSIERSVARPKARSFLGTPAYVSPEQAAGSRVDHRTDLYAVGVILFELVTGHLPFQAASLDQFLVQHATAPVPHLPEDLQETELGRALDAIIQRCMAKEPAARFGSAAELAGLFAALARGELPEISTVTSIRARRAAFPRRAIVLALVAVVALVAGTLVLAARSGRVAPSGPARSEAASVPAPSPALVSIAFETQPAGAEVHLASTGELLGVTPFRRAFPRAPSGGLVEISRAGFVSRRLEVPTGTDRTVRARLVRVPERRPRSHWPSRPVGAEKTINPFFHR